MTVQFKELMEKKERKQQQLNENEKNTYTERKKELASMYTFPLGSKRVCKLQQSYQICGITKESTFKRQKRKKKKSTLDYNSFFVLFCFIGISFILILAHVSRLIVDHKRTQCSEQNARG